MEEAQTLLFIEILFLLRISKQFEEKYVGILNIPLRAYRSKRMN